MARIKEIIKCLFNAKFRFDFLTILFSDSTIVEWAILRLLPVAKKKKKRKTNVEVSITHISINFMPWILGGFRVHMYSLPPIRRGISGGIIGRSSFGTRS